MSFQARASLFMCMKGLTKPFNHSIGALSLVQACLCARKDLESSFHHCGRPVNPVQACLCTREDLESSFHHCRSCEARESLFINR